MNRVILPVSDVVLLRALHLPDDIRITNAQVPFGQSWQVEFVLEHPSFPDVERGNPFPRVTGRYDSKFQQIETVHFRGFTFPDGRTVILANPDKA